MLTKVRRSIGLLLLTGFATHGRNVAPAAVPRTQLTRPVKLVGTRDQGFTISTYRAETRRHVRLGAQRDGKIVGYSHEGAEVT
ncbi:MAG TPA: molybdopterin cofactor-binding domain-containing protein, partial [Casimicrobiaceae bacterium]|nr:molybdopterin cofactor-binding domain-containing protein [Casimicrobiaceae bacterium]